MGTRDIDLLDFHIKSMESITIANPIVCSFYVPINDYDKSPYSQWWTEKRCQLIEKAKKKTVFKNKIIINSITFLAFICAIVLAFLFAYFVGSSSIMLGAAMGLGIFALRMNLEMKYETNISFVHLVRMGKNY